MTGANQDVVVYVVYEALSAFYGLMTDSACCSKRRYVLRASIRQDSLRRGQLESFLRPCIVVGRPRPQLDSCTGAAASHLHPHQPDMEADLLAPFGIPYRW